jgi:hypothetical protein
LRRVPSVLQRWSASIEKALSESQRNQTSSAKELAAFDAEQRIARATANAASRGPARARAERPASLRKILGKQVLSSFAKTANSNTVFGMVKRADLAACSVRRGRGLCFT